MTYRESPYADAGYREQRAPRRRDGVLVRAVRALSGAVAAGVVVLAFVVVGAAVLGGREGFPGPGTVSLATHVAGAAVALIAQSWADRRFGIRALPGSLVVFVVLAALLWTQWWG